MKERGIHEADEDSMWCSGVSMRTAPHPCREAAVRPGSAFRVLADRRVADKIVDINSFDAPTVANS